MAWTTTELLAKARLLAYLPSASTLAFTNAELLSIGDKATSDRFTPWLVQKRVELFVRRSDVAIVLGTDAYRLPARAYGSKLRSVTFIDSNGNGYPVDEWTLDRRDKLLQGNPFLGSGGYAFCLEGDNLLLLPVPQTAGTLRMRYYRRPSKLVLVTASGVGQITSISLVTGVILTTATGITTSTPIDFVQQNPNFDVLGADVSPTAASSGVSVTVALASIPAELAVGDWIAFAGESPVPQVPADLHDALADAIGIQVARSLGNIKAVGIAEAFVTDALNRLDPAFVPRSDGGAKVIVNRKSQLRRGRL